MKLYKTILADPPWQYRNKNTGGSMKSGSAAKYSTMSLNEICAIKIPADRDCCLFLWATTPLLPEAFEVMKAWGFKYKTTIYWRKIMSLGMGFWFRGQVEVCLFGIRGKVKAFRCQRPNFLQTKAGRHSEKPRELMELITPITPAPRLEMFARSRYPRWDACGLEIKQMEGEQK